MIKIKAIPFPLLRQDRLLIFLLKTVINLSKSSGFPNNDTIYSSKSWYLIYTIQTMNTDNIILPIQYRIRTLDKKNEYVVFL